MSSIIRATNYKKLLDTISGLVHEAKQTEYVLEGADGKKRDFKIHSMSIHIISVIEKKHTFENHALTKKETETKTTALINIWIKDKHKMVQSQLGFNDMTLDADNFTIFFKQNINDWVNGAVREFMRVEKKDTKSSYKSADPPEVYMESIKIRTNAFKSLENSAKMMTKHLHVNVSAIRNVETTLGQHCKIFLMVDTEGRKILTKSNEYFCIIVKVTFINKQRYEIDKMFVRYALTEKEMKEDIREIKANVKQTVKESNELEHLKSGFYPVLMKPSSSEILFHEGIAGHILSGQLVVDEETNIFQELGQDLIVDPRFEILKQIRIENKPSMQGTIATYKFDHEGIRAKDQILLDKGIICNYLTNRNSAWRLGQHESNGSSLAETFMNEEDELREPEPRISNLIITSYSRKTEATLRKEIIKYCKRQRLDFYLEIESGNGEVDIENANFVMKLDECNMVFLDGTRKKAWGGVLSGDIFFFISMIKGISKETETIQGMCGSTSGDVPAYSEAPYMIMEMCQFKPTKKPDKVDLYLHPKYVPPRQTRKK